MTHPLIDAVLELKGAADPFLRKAGSHRLTDAIADLVVHGNEVVVRDIAAGHGELTVEVFVEVVRRAKEAGLPYTELAAAFHRAQGSE